MSCARLTWERILLKFSPEFQELISPEVDFAGYKVLKNTENNQQAFFHFNYLIMKSLIIRSSLFLCCLVSIASNVKAITIYVNTFNYYPVDIFQTPPAPPNSTYEAYAYIENTNGDASLPQDIGPAYMGMVNSAGPLTFYNVTPDEKYRLVIVIVRSDNHVLVPWGYSDWETAYAIAIKVTPDPIKVGA